VVVVMIFEFGNRGAFMSVEHGARVKALRILDATAMNGTNENLACTIILYVD
jgi:hypothetical protein